MYDLIKFTSEKQFAESFLKGKLYMNSLGYFWSNGYQSQRDLFEGTFSYAKPEDMMFPDDLSAVIDGKVMNRLEAMKYCNLFCMVKHGYDPIRKQVERIDLRMKSFGEYAVIVRDLETFVNRIYDVLISMKDCYGLMGPVSYHSRYQELKESDCFDKCDDFIWQKEWRLAFLNNYSELKDIAAKNPEAPYDVPCTLDIGDISNIAEIYESKALFDNIQIAYSGFREVDKIFENKKARKLVSKGIPAVYGVFCDGFIGWNPRRSFLQKIIDLNEGKMRPAFIIGES